MNKFFLISICLSSLFFSFTTFAADQAVVIKYGKVTDVQTVKQQGEHAGGALAGGLLAATLAGPRHRGLKIATSAAAGAAIQGATTSGEAQLYTVRLMSGGEAKVTTEQVDIRVGDCVSVEQSGDHANIRRVSTYHCETTEKNDPPEHHQTKANYCQQAKAELAKAESDHDIETAVKKVRVLCED